MFRNITLSALAALTLTTTTLLLAQEEEAPLRIEKLMSRNWNVVPTIDPVLPENFVARDSPTDYLVWGTPEDTDLIFEDGAELETGVIALRYAANIAQIGPDRFSGDSDEELYNGFKQFGVQDFAVERLQWGDYPVLAISGRMPSGQLLRVAWLGLNQPYGLTVGMQFHAPKDGCCEIWDAFLHETTQLSESDCFRARGMNMKEGYTLYSAATGSLKATVEKRRSDSKLAVMLEPLTPNTSYKLSDVFEVRMGSKWKYGEPCTKIEGTITVKGGRFGTCVNTGTITVLTQEVDEFSFDTNSDSHPEGVVVATFEEY